MCADSAFCFGGLASVASSGAEVEQSAAAAESLREQAQKLAQLVSQFVLRREDRHR